MLDEIDTIMAEIRESAAELEAYNRKQEEARIVQEEYNRKRQREKFAAKLIRKELDKAGHVRVIFIDGDTPPEFSGAPAYKKRVNKYSWGGRYAGARTEHVRSTERITVGKQYKTVAHLL